MISPCAVDDQSNCDMNSAFARESEIQRKREQLVETAGYRAMHTALHETIAQNTYSTKHRLQDLLCCVKFYVSLRDWWVIQY